MENKQTPNNKPGRAYNGRFGDDAPARSTATVRKPRADEGPRRPSGFGSTAQGKKSRPAARPAPVAEPAEPSKKAVKAKKKRAKVEKKQAKRRFPLLKLLLILLVLALAAGLTLLILRAGSKTPHHMPTIEYKSDASFAPDNTPIPTEET